MLFCSSTVLGNNTIYIKMDWGFGYWPVKEMEQTFKKQGYKVKEVRSLANLKDVAFIITYDVPRSQINLLLEYPKEKRVLVMWEPPVIKPYNYDTRYHNLFGKILTFNPTLVDNTKYFQCYYTVRKPMIAQTVPFEDRKFAILINTNKSYNHPSEIFSERAKTVAYFNEHCPQKLDAFGNGWGKYANCNRGRLGGNSKWDDKVQVIKNYKFCVCYENSTIPGYITEKIFDVFRSGTVPIYWGPQDIETTIPEDCYIRRDRFSSHEELLQFLDSITKEQHEQYLANIRRFLASDKSMLFSEQNFVDTLTRALLS